MDLDVIFLSWSGSLIDRLLVQLGILQQPGRLCTGRAMRWSLSHFSEFTWQGR